MSNRLIGEKSPYLLHHAHNPVDWFPWGVEAFTKAKAEDKPVFLSIGYSACHWCHVMERESFEDTEVAEALNRDFVAVKVDREERPDIDAVYMRVCRSLTGSGGWPLTVFMTPDQRPFYAGTYFPKNARYGVPGLLDLLGAVGVRWKNDRASLTAAGEKILDALREIPEKDGRLFSLEDIRNAEKAFERSYDPKYGGFGTRPKFPSPHNLMFLMRFHALEKDGRALEMAEGTLRGICRGGITDPIGGGFMRYSTDEKWLVPHFEKMLYDNALLICAYLDAFQITGKELYRKAAQDALSYVLREMTAPEGGFYSSQDADSGGAEGKYYVFTPKELAAVLGTDDGAYFCARFGIAEKGNFGGASIPNRLDDVRFGEADERLDALVEKVFEYRCGRIRPERDDKILTSWNALMIAAFADAYRVLGREAYLREAVKAMNFIEGRMTREGRLSVSFCGGKTNGEGTLDDYAFLGLACLALYGATYQARWLLKAAELCAQIGEHFADTESGGFFLTPDDGERLIFRAKETFDGAVPSGNSAAALLLIKLSKLTGDTALSRQAEAQLRFMAGAMRDYPAGHSFALMAWMHALYPSREVVCVSASEEDTRRLKDALRHVFPADTSVLVKDAENAAELARAAAFTEPYGLRDGATAYYLCENGACSAPVADLGELLRTLAPDRQGLKAE